MADTKIQYKDGPSELVYRPLWWHMEGLTQTATGYGKKLTTPYKTEYNGRLYRVYQICFSNAATSYILPKGQALYLREISHRGAE